MKSLVQLMFLGRTLRRSWLSSRQWCFLSIIEGFKASSSLTALFNIVAWWSWLTMMFLLKTVYWIRKISTFLFGAKFHITWRRSRKVWMESGLVCIYDRNWLSENKKNCTIWDIKKLLMCWHLTQIRGFIWGKKKSSEPWSIIILCTSAVPGTCTR